MQLKMVKNEAHLAAGGSYLYLKEYIFTIPSCSPCETSGFMHTKVTNHHLDSCFFTLVGLSLLL